MYSLTQEELHKKPSLDSIILDNFCPVSNLPFLGKVVDKVVVKQLQRTLDEADYLDLFQLGFRQQQQQHGRETALIMLLDDHWCEWDGVVHSSLVFLTSWQSLIILSWYPFGLAMRIGAGWNCIVLVLRLSPGLLPVNVDRECEVPPSAPTVWGAAQG